MPISLSKGLLGLMRRFALLLDAQKQHLFKKSVGWRFQTIIKGGFDSLFGILLLPDCHSSIQLSSTTISQLETPKHSLKTIQSGRKNFVQMSSLAHHPALKVEANLYVYQQCSHLNWKLTASQSRASNCRSRSSSAKRE